MITKEEYEELKECQERGLYWIASDFDRSTWAFSQKAKEKKAGEWYVPFDVDTDLLKNKYRGISFEDDEATYIKDLLDDYENKSSN